MPLFFSRQYANYRKRSGLSQRSFCVVLLQRSNREALSPERLDGIDGRGRTGERGNRRNAVHHRDAANRAVVEEGLAAKRSVDDEVNLVVQDLVADVGTPLV